MQPLLQRDVLNHVYSFLDSKDIHKSKRVCKTLEKQGKQTFIWRQRREALVQRINDFFPLVLSQKERENRFLLFSIDQQELTQEERDLLAYAASHNFENGINLNSLEESEKVDKIPFDLSQLPSSEIDQFFKDSHLDFSEIESLFYSRRFLGLRTIPACLKGRVSQEDLNLINKNHLDKNESYYLSLAERMNPNIWCDFSDYDLSIVERFAKKLQRKPEVQRVEVHGTLSDRAFEILKTSGKTIDARDTLRISFKPIRYLIVSVVILAFAIPIIFKLGLATACFSAVSALFISVIVGSLWLKYEQGRSQRDRLFVPPQHL